MKSRDFTRVNFAVGASICYGRQVAICTTSNLSLRGIYLRTGFELPLNAQVQVSIYHSDLSSIKVNAKVVRREENGIGLQITNLKIDSFGQLREIVTERSKDRVTVMQEIFKMIQCIS